MKLIHVAAALALLGMTGAAQGLSEARQNESAFTVDLLEPLGRVYHVKCENGYEILKCQQPSVWEDTNRLTGLQTFKRPVGNEMRDPDFPLVS